MLEKHWFSCITLMGDYVIAGLRDRSSGELLPPEAESVGADNGDLGCSLYTGSPASKNTSKFLCLRFSVLNIGFSTCNCRSSRSLFDSLGSDETERPNFPRGICNLGFSSNFGDREDDDFSGGKSMGDIGRPQPGPNRGCVGSGGANSNSSRRQSSVGRGAMRGIEAPTLANIATTSNYVVICNFLVDSNTMKVEVIWSSQYICQIRSASNNVYRFVNTP
ncbi:hypothetical protein GQX74_009791 [Glossina fuscipes]|nr:hypothetical protein GQX74_009791 [Glossina fuscipes]